MNELYRSYDELPLLLTIPEVAMLLRISRAEAYKLSHREGFPVTLVTGKRRMVAKDALFVWLDRQSVPLAV